MCVFLVDGHRVSPSFVDLKYLFKMLIYRLSLPVNKMAFKSGGCGELLSGKMEYMDLKQLINLAFDRQNNNISQCLGYVTLSTTQSRAVMLISN